MSFHLIPNKPKKNHHRSAGFTLLEVLIAMTILIFIAISIFQATTGTYRIRDELITEGDFYNTIRLSMGVLERDLSLIYTPKIMLPAATAPAPVPNGGPPPVGSSNSPMNDPSLANYPDLQTTSTYWEAAVHKNGFRPAHFIGKDNMISFIAVSKMRVYKDSKESEFVKIKYEMKPDPDSKASDEGGHNVLVKTENINAFGLEDTRDKTVRNYNLLPGITKLKFRYYRKEKKDWVMEWDSDSSDLKDTFPDMIEVSLEVQGSKRLAFDGLYRFRPEIPLTGVIDASY